MRFNSSSNRLSRLEEYLYDGNYEQAVQYCSENKSIKISNDTERILLAKAYFLDQNYDECLNLLSKVKTNVYSSNPNVETYF